MAASVSPFLSVTSIQNARCSSLFNSNLHKSHSLWIYLYSLLLMPKSMPLGANHKAEILICVGLTQYVVPKRHLNDHT